MKKFISEVKSLNNNHVSRFPKFIPSEFGFSKDYTESITQLISKADIPVSTILDIACGHGNHIDSIHNAFGSFCIGIDIKKFPKWNTFSNKNIEFIEKDIDNVIHHIKCKQKFDIILTMNTLRGIDKFSKEYLETFLNWCKSSSDYLITNHCTNITLPGFELILTNNKPSVNSHIYDVNLFKALK